MRWFVVILFAALLAIEPLARPAHAQTDDSVAACVTPESPADLCQMACCQTASPCCAPPTQPAPTQTPTSPPARTAPASIADAPQVNPSVAWTLPAAEPLRPSPSSPALPPQARDLLRRSCVLLL